MGFIGKRLGVTLLTLLLVSILTFAAFRIIPGDAALLALGTEATAEQIARERAERGLDRSVAGQYVSWLGNFLSGRLGNSARFRGASISGLILERLPVTGALAGMSLVFIVCLALPCSLCSVKRENSLISRLITALAALNISVPGFFLGILFIWVFGLGLRLFVPGAYVAAREDVAGFWGYLAFPALAIALPNAALLVKFLRSSIFRELHSEYVRTAWSKGNSRGRILRRHVLKNACLPALTVLGMISGEIFSGSVVIEQVFNIPGIGRLLLASISARDYPLVETLMIYIALVVILANTLVDIVIQIIDPRIRLSGSS
jgi:ABC-type dipeptide/oligopeptide/nickel transport system permease component